MWMDRSKNSSRGEEWRPEDPTLPKGWMASRREELRPEDPNPTLPQGWMVSQHSNLPEGWKS